MTIHGHHRVDGSLGGFRTNRQKVRVTSDSLYSASVKSIGEVLQGEESMAFKNGSTTSSADT